MTYVIVALVTLYILIAMTMYHYTRKGAVGPFGEAFYDPYAAEDFAVLCASLWPLSIFWLVPRFVRWSYRFIFITDQSGEEIHDTTTRQ